ncbi:MAG: DNA polymerase III subunit gamma/tau [Chitinophagaceae bacterium]|nr:DNA polymerase III subunit gamma/tau [Chitinophagaceae bacterium]
MDKFIVSARKYRPQEFNTVVGQAHITTTLKNAIKNNQLAHAFLFCGPRGVGKTTCARILAKTINCTNITPEGEACNTCSSCISFNDGGSLNIHELDAASNNSVDDIRSLVEQVRFAPQAGKYKIYIVDEVHMLSASAFNAFLKTLEEPPSYAIFILATTEKHKILPTILSRCQIFDFKRITTNDTVEHLQEIIDKEHIKADKAALQIIAQKSEGCMRDALSILDKIVSFSGGEVDYQNTIEHLNILDHDYYFKLIQHLKEQDLAAALLLFDEINRKGFEGDMVLNGFAEFLRNILVCKDAKAAQLLDVVEGMQEKYYATAQNLEIGYIISSLNILNEAELAYKMARNKKLHIELSLIKLSFLQQAIELSTQNGQIVKKKLVDDAVGLKFRAIQSLQVKPPKEAKLFVEQEPKQPATKTITSPYIPEEKPVTTTQVFEPKPETKKSVIQTASSQKNAVKKSLLDVLREKAGDKYTVESVKEAEPLTMERLTACIELFTKKLDEAGGKISTVSTIQSARVELISEIYFKFYVPSITAQKSIDQEKSSLIDLLYNSFNNSAINFSVELEEQEGQEEDRPVLLSSRERYELMIAQFPMIKVLKDKLKMELDI